LGATYTPSAPSAPQRGRHSPRGIVDLVLQSHKLRSGSWRTVSSTKTRSAGGYRFTVKPGGSRVYRVVWRGVKTSATRTVRVYPQTGVRVPLRDHGGDAGGHELRAVAFPRPSVILKV